MDKVGAALTELEDDVDLAETKALEVMRKELCSTRTREQAGNLLTAAALVQRRFHHIRRAAGFTLLLMMAPEA